ncbi:MAG TPA: alpha-L-rhamnosidase [Bacteroides sp.]|nr:alpha-L-rhamnosidase [Bacteroides sp.]
MKTRHILSASILLLFPVLLAGAGLQVTSLKTDYKSGPLGIDNTRPMLSWVILSDRMNTLQESYEIRAALSERDLERGRNLVWETGRVSSSRSIHVPYEGTPLQSFQRVYWQVRIRDNHGQRSGWSNVASWEMGILDSNLWNADWISPLLEEKTNLSNPSPFLRKEFNLRPGISKARLYISSHGLYRAEINGKRVGDQEFTPGWTSYRHRVQYQTYDVTGLLNASNNAMGIILGDGWFRGNLAWSGNRNVYGSRLAAIARLHVWYADGSEAVIGTDDSWKAGTGPIISSDIYNGETYDATRELAGWSSPGYDDGDWEGVETMEIPMEKLIATEGPPVKIVDELIPVSIEKAGDGQWLVDMGQNMVGRVRISVSGNRGDTITLRHAEVLDREGKMYYDNLRSAEATNRYVMKGAGTEVFEPHFTFQGFRYVMVSGYPGVLKQDAIRGMVIHSDMGQAGTFSCSDSLINQLQHNIVWGLKGNFLDVPTDCPQRDERLGWTGDAQVFAPTACFNMQAATFYKKWLRDMAADQTAEGMIHNVIPDVLGGGGATGWADAGVVIPWVVYMNYADTSVLEDQYESMKKWIGYMQARAGEDMVWDGDFHFGDWLSFDDSSPAYMGAYTLTDLLATAYFAYSSGIVSDVAAILGKNDEAAHYKELSEQVKHAFRDEFVTPNGRLVSHTQTAYTLALAFDLLDERTEQLAARHLGNNVQQFGHITTGFLGTPLISLTLTGYGMNELAYLLLNRKEYPSWLYPVTMGATTIWERWDGQKPDSTFQDPGMNSFNHYAYGAIGKWLYQVVAGIGIDPDQPGYKHVIIHPRPGGGLTWAKASHESMYGTITSGWELDGDQLTMEVEIPANTTASLHITGQPEQIVINGTGLTQSGISYRTTEAGVVAEAGSGRYEIITTREEAGQ